MNSTDKHQNILLFQTKKKDSNTLILTNLKFISILHLINQDQATMMNTTLMLLIMNLAHQSSSIQATMSMHLETLIIK